MQSATELQFLSSNGDHTVFASIWEPEDSPRGVIQLCHGMVEHIGRYDWLARQLTQHGFAVCGDDHLGHGRTARTEAERGYFGEKDGYIHLVEDEHRMRQEMQKRYPGLPCFLLGHSMGSFMVRLYAARYGEGLNGCLCCGTAGHNSALNFALALSNVCVKLRGGKRRGKLIHRIAFKDYNKRYENVVTGTEWLSRDAEVYKQYADDTMCGFIFTNAGFRDMFHLLKAVNGKAWSNQIPKTLPIILLSGEMDPVGNYGAGVKEVYGWLKESGIQDVTLKLYPEARHELHNELNRDEFVSDIVSWMEKRM